MPLKRQIVSMPESVRRRLEAAGLASAYAARPAYQRNDYLWWITAAKRPATRQKRLDQMLEELRSGDRYMGMPYRSRLKLVDSGVHGR